jgi:uncharacterized protein (DUF2141 family)
MRLHLLILVAIIPFELYAATGKIEVQVTGLKNDKGQIMLALHNNADTFPTKPKQAIQTLTAKITNQQAKVTFENVSPGIYAIAVFHDENNNNKLDSNFIGIPTEGVGTSNDAKGHFGPPRFSDAKFTMTHQSHSIKIAIQY